MATSESPAVAIVNRHRSKGRFVIAIVGVIALWSIIALTWPLAVASPIDTLSEVWSLLTLETGLVVETIYASLFRIFVGFFVSLLFGTAIGVAMGVSTQNEDYLYIIVLIGMMIPSLSWAMITLVVLGLSEIAIISAIVLTTTPFIAVTVWEGVKDINQDLLEMATMYDLSGYNRMRHVIVPQISPYVFSAARYGLGLCWKITVVVELLGASSGIGYQLNAAFNLFSLEAVFAWTLILIVIMIFVEYGIIRTISRHVFSWRGKGGHEWR